MTNVSEDYKRGYKDGAVDSLKSARVAAERALREGKDLAYVIGGMMAAREMLKSMGVTEMVRAVKAMVGAAPSEG